METSLALLRDLYLANSQFEHALSLTDFLLEPTYIDLENLVKRHYILEKLHMHTEASKTDNWIKRLDPNGSRKPLLDDLENSHHVRLEKYVPAGALSN